MKHATWRAINGDERESWQPLEMSRDLQHQSALCGAECYFARPWRKYYAVESRLCPVSSSNLTFFCSGDGIPDISRSNSSNLAPTKNLYQ